MMLLWTWCVSDGQRRPFLLGISVGVDLLGYKVSEYLALVETRAVLRGDCIRWQPHRQCVRMPLLRMFLFIWPL